MAIAVKVEGSSCLVFFSQTRVGVKGTPFPMYKFRFMLTDTEARHDALIVNNEVEGAMSKMKDDPNETKVGRIIRNISVEEQWKNGTVSI